MPPSSIPHGTVSMPRLLFGLVACTIVFLVSLRGECQEKDDKKADPIPIEQTENFDQIHLLGTSKLYIRHAAKCGVAGPKRKGIAGLPPFQIRKNTLMILRKGTLPSLLKDADGNTVDFVIDVRDLKSFKLSGIASGEISGLQGENLEISLAGTGGLLASGSIDNLYLDVSGIGGFNGRKLQAKTAKIKHSGSGRILVNAKNRLEVVANNIGLIEYLGMPKIRATSSGVGRLAPLKE